MRFGVTSSSLSTPRTWLSCCFWYNNSRRPGCCVTLWSHIKKKPDCKWKCSGQFYSCSNHRLQAKHFSSSSALFWSSSPSSRVPERRSRCKNTTCGVQSPRECSEPYAATAYTVLQQRWDLVEILFSFSVPLILQVCSPVANLITCSSKSHDSFRSWKWKPSPLEGGHEFQAFSSYTRARGWSLSSSYQTYIILTKLETQS